MTAHHVVVLDSDYETYAMARIDPNHMLVRMWHPEDAVLREIVIEKFGGDMPGKYWATKIPFLVDTYLAQRVPTLGLDKSSWKQAQDMSMSEQADLVAMILAHSGIALMR